MLGTNDMQRLLIVAIVAVAAVVGGGLVVATVGTQPTLTVPPVQYETTYHPDSESMTIHHVGGNNITQKFVSGVRNPNITVVVAQGYATESQPPPEFSATIVAHGERSTDGMWVGSTSDALQTEGRHGDSVLVVSDGTDQDGDGVAGIEPGERVLVRYGESERRGLTRVRTSATLHAKSV